MKRERSLWRLGGRGPSDLRLAFIRRPAEIEVEDEDNSESRYLVRFRAKLYKYTRLHAHRNFSSAVLPGMSQTMALL